MSRTVWLVVALALCTVLIGVFTNVGTSYLPPWVRPYGSYAWLALAVTVLLWLLLLIIDKRWQQTASAPPDAAQLKRSRERMLARVRHDWIDGVLKQSLYEVARIDLGLEERTDLVERPLTLVIQEAGSPARLLPPRTKLRGIFEAHAAAGGLLILGEPGGGKTTLLLELAQHLLDRAAVEEKELIPVLFSLSSWALRRPCLADWLVDELNERYGVPLNLAQHWVRTDQILPLLDGLDEVASEHRDACVDSINEYHSRHFLPIAVCSRTDDYQRLSQRLRMPAAVVIQPLTPADVDRYLQRGGKRLAALRAALAGEEALRQLLDTPLMLSIAMLAYQAMPEPETVANGTLESRRRLLFARYVATMFDRRTKETCYDREQTTRSLAWLACSMTRLGQGVFYLESLNRDWLETRAQRVVLRWSACLAFALGIAAIALLDSWEVVPAFSAVPLLRLGRERPVDRLRWSRPKFSRLDLLALLLGAVLILVVERETVSRLLLCPFVLLVLATAKVMYQGIATAEFDLRAVANGGTWRSGRNALMIGLAIFGWFSAAFVGNYVLSYAIFGFELKFGIDRLLVEGLDIALISGLVMGVMLASEKGLTFFLQHWCMRFLLWRSGNAPFQYVRFLDYAADRIFLRKVGGGYIFAHRMLMEYFASLGDVEGRAQVSTAAGK